MIKLSVNETTYMELFASQDPRSYSLYFDLKFDFGPEKLTGLSGNGSQTNTQSLQITEKQRYSFTLGVDTFVCLPSPARDVKMLPITTYVLNKLKLK